ncbi:MAG: hypothetical protein ACXWZB_03530, partial [Gaiellaceae bacterium]
MTRELSQNERRLAALAAIAFLWGALLVAVGFALWFVAVVVGGPLLIAAGFLGRGSVRIGRVDWSAGRETAVRQATAALSRIRSRGETLRRELSARRRPRPATPGRRDARR